MQVLFINQSETSKRVLLESQRKQSEISHEVILMILSLFFNFFRQIANHTGYIKVDWKRVEKDVNKAKKQLKQGTKQAGPELNTMVEKVTSEKNLPL